MAADVYIYFSAVLQFADDLSASSFCYLIDCDFNQWINASHVFGSSEFSRQLNTSSVVGDAVTCYKCKGNVTSACGESLVNVNGIALCVGDFCLLRKYQKSGTEWFEITMDSFTPYYGCNIISNIAKLLTGPSV